MPDQGRRDAGSRKVIKSWGNTLIESGHAHLGDVLSDLTIAGGLHVHFHCSEMRYRLSWITIQMEITKALQQAQQAFDMCVSNGTLSTPRHLATPPVEDLLAESSTHQTSSDDPIALFYRESIHLAAILSHEASWCSQWKTFIWKALQTIPFMIDQEQNILDDFCAAVSVVAAACNGVREGSSRAKMHQLGVMLMIFIYNAVLWASNDRSGGAKTTTGSKLEYAGFAMILESLRNRHLQHAARHNASWHSSSVPAFSDCQQLPNNCCRLGQEHQLQVVSKLLPNSSAQQLSLGHETNLLNDAESTSHDIFGPRLPSLVQIADSFFDPWQEKEFRRLALGRTRRIRSGQYAPIDASIRAKLQKICESSSKSFCVLEGSLPQRTMLTDAKLELIHIIQEANIPVLYLLNLLSERNGQPFTTLDCLKYFALQLVKATISHHQNDLLSYKLAQCQKRDNVEAWLQVIESAATRISQVFLVVSLCAVADHRTGASTLQNFVLMEALRMVMEIMVSLSPAPSIKCIVMSDSQSAGDFAPSLAFASSTEFMILKLPRKIISGPAKRKLPPLHRKTKLIKLR